MGFSDFYGPLYLSSFVVGFLLVIVWILISGFWGAFKGGKTKLFAYYIAFPIIVLGPVSIITVHSSKIFFNLNLIEETQNKKDALEDRTYEYQFDEITSILKELSDNSSLSPEDQEKLSELTSISHHTRQILVGQKDSLKTLLNEASKKFLLGIISSLFVGTIVGLLIVPAFNEKK